ncbi:SprT family zinc-dependent metalloprotease [Acinetobacter radioresistens]|jgi:predicted metal-dependent hydrolase|uniref:YgjP-like metallopeptidase domain-containing protein n=1 Tax=Acinetobacter radioresistens SK82 TaxID=596318 RepID=A0ABP2GK03_ACIRA|nr:MULTISPECIES: SprT family zinc-dependent metalloprotease [Acinetobacter]EET81667.1 hypothetical protein ACIRA0001_1830 [Acinetobacter radioresistens SK82]EEY87552.1 hypothetical protein HMPREF0018_00299 [Acinetobacter radioresistens SH164]ENV87876.1 hypothetical protein F940_00342 [Acinetobacter radioresistens NIPH 2130]EXB85776.1 hypothetical protein J538_1717 [Acinetobacter sp. 272263]EXE56871.1 hypothetical protein J579_2333 [Acinetobacter sp. 1239920]
MQQAELPEIRIVRHATAKRLRLRVEPQGVRLTVPLRCTKKQIEQFLSQAENWLLETWHKQQSQIPDLFSIPESIKFFNCPAELAIKQCAQKNSFILNIEQQILINQNHPEHSLKACVIDQAKQLLPDYLESISQEIGLPYKTCSIRQPKTRWGSCSSVHDIMLHAGAILMPEQLVRYLCIHELAHTRHFNHSPLFWAEVTRHDPDYLVHRQQLKSYKLPGWWYV